MFSLMLLPKLYAHKRANLLRKSNKVLKNVKKLGLYLFSFNICPIKSKQTFFYYSIKHIIYLKQIIMKTSSKSQINNSLKNELFSLNQLVKFATKGDGKQYIQEYIKGKKVTLKDITIANLAPVMLENLKFTRVKNQETGKFELTKEKRTKFSFWVVLTLVDLYEKTL